MFDVLSSMFGVRCSSFDVMSVVELSGFIEKTSDQSSDHLPLYSEKRIWKTQLDQRRQGANPVELWEDLK